METVSETLDPLEAVPPPPAWAGLVRGDYQLAVVRVATLIRQKENHLLWASVELLPVEIAPPPDAGDHMAIGTDRLVFSRTVLSFADAMAWYEAGLAGSFTVPGKTVSIVAGGLGAEPPGRWFVLRNDLPFSPDWHLGGRVHRLVPMVTVAAPVLEMASGMTTIGRFRRARLWLEERLHFDLLAHDDWLGSVVLVAPNPVARTCGARIVARGDGRETVQVTAQPRTGVSVAGLCIVFQERRAGAAGWRDQVPLDLLGRASTTVPAEIDALGHELVCPVRGLLHEDLPAPFFRSFTVGMPSTVRQRVVHPPRRRRTGPAPPAYRANVREIDAVSATPAPERDALRRLQRLQRQREDRFGDARPLEADRGRPAFRVFASDREEAVDFVRRLIAGARRRLLFVDPYFGAADLLEFAYAAEAKGIAVSVLLSPLPKLLKQAPIDGPPGTETNGNWLNQLIGDMASPDSGFGAVDVRVATEARIHDRFLVVDDQVWHCGHSFNKVGGGELSAMGRVAQPLELLRALDQVFERGAPFAAWYAVLPAPVRSFRSFVTAWLRGLAKRIERPGDKGEDVDDS